MEEKSLIKLNRNILKDPNVKIFSKAENGELYYIVSLDSQEGTKSHSERIAIAKFRHGNLKDINKLCRRILVSISGDKIDKRLTNQLISKLKEVSDTTFTDEGKTIFNSIRGNRIEAEDISIERNIRIEKVINYDTLEKKMPKATVDVRKIPIEDIKEIGQEVTERLEVLKGINEDDAIEYRESLVSFMTNREISTTNKERILSNYIKNIQRLDKTTILECLKAMENETESNENKLYPIYLRLKEKSAISRVQEYLIGLKFKEEIPDGRIERYLQNLEEQKSKSIEGKDIETIIQEVGNKELEITERYLDKDRNIDFEIMRYLSQFKENDKEKTKILEFLKSRISSLRQVGKVEEKRFELREYLEQANFEADNSLEENWFLYQVAKVERDYLNSKFGVVLERYNELDKNTELDAKEEKLRKLEKEKSEAKELYKEYEQLDKNGKDPEEKDDKPIE